MAKLFVYDRSADSLFEGLGLTKEESFGMFKTLATAIEKNILEFGEVTDEGVQIPETMAEYMQEVAGYLDKELTPELGFAIGLVLSDIGDITNKVLAMLVQQGRI